MNRPSRMTRGASVVIPVALLIVVVGLSVAVNGELQRLTTAARDGSLPGEETIRVGIRYGPGAVNQIAISASSGGLIVRSLECPEGMPVPGDATVRVAAADSETERVYRLKVGEYSDLLGAEKRLAELAARVERPVDRAVGTAGGYYVAYIGRSPRAADMDKLKAELGLTSRETEIDVFDLPHSMSLELTFTDGSTPVQTGGDRVVFTSAAPGGVTSVGSPMTGYRGSIEVLLSPEGALEVVNEISLEDYLRSAVGGEMSSYAPPEALKAQTVLMRTYAINHMIAPKHDAFHVCDTHHCQTYRGVSSESHRIDAAVEATAGEVLGSDIVVPVQVYYHAACGGLTESSRDVWGTDLPHLVSTLCGDTSGLQPVDLSSEAAAAAFIESDSEYYCSDSSNYRWERDLSEEDLLRIVRSPETVGSRQAIVPEREAAGTESETGELPGGVHPASQLTSVSVLSRTSAGRVAQIEIIAGGQRVVLSGNIPIRTALGDSGLLPSCFFVVKPVQQELEALGSPLYVLSGAGYGHGVGMCQTGAIGMARDGYDYIQILEHYFRGTGVMSR